MTNRPKLFIPGPTEVRDEILAKQAQPLIGHRTREMAELYARLQTGLKALFCTQSRVYISASSGSGLLEAASRNCIRDGRRVLHLVNGAFSQRWAEISRANGKQVETIEIPWGEAHDPEDVKRALAEGGFDALAFAFNETSTGALNPLPELARAAREFPEVLVLVDAVSALGGVKVETDAAGLDVCATSSQKCLALPPGLAFAAVSDRALARATEVRHRGYYFDFLALEEYLLRNTTPATPALSLMFALEAQLDAIAAEGLEARFSRHVELAVLTREWAVSRGFAIFPQAGYESPTETVVRNTRGIDVAALNVFLGQRGMMIGNGYGKLKDVTFRIAHMGDITRADIETLLTAIDEFLSL